MTWNNRRNVFFASKKCVEKEEKHAVFYSFVLVCVCVVCEKENEEEEEEEEEEG